MEDGQLNLVATISKSGYFNIIFTAISVKETEDSFAARKAEAEKAIEEQEKANETAGNQYSYIDKNLTANTEYSYKIAAVVDGKTSLCPEH